MPRDDVFQLRKAVHAALFRVPPGISVIIERMRATRRKAFPRLLLSIDLIGNRGSQADDETEQNEQCGHVMQAVACGDMRLT